MTRKEAKEIIEKLNTIISEYPELKLTAKVTFSEDCLDKSKIHTFITLQNGSVSSDDQADFCKEYDIPYAQYKDGTFINSSFDVLSFNN